MAYTRKNVWELGGDWADPILWYARAVAKMKQRPLATPTSWRFYGAMHGIDPALWKRYGYLSASDTLPPNAVQQQFWAQCQHSTWYFLPWHRGYLFAFEANIRAIVQILGGPSDWALPYWNYFKPNQDGLPPDADPAAHADHLAGKVALFGVRSASKADGDHAGNGLTFSLEITPVVDKLHLQDGLTDELPVRIVPSRPLTDKAQVTIGRVSVFRQGG